MIYPIRGIAGQATGGNWVDTEVQVDETGPNTLITSRKPDDLPAFCATLVRVFARQARLGWWPLLGVVTGAIGLVGTHNPGADSPRPWRATRP